MLAGCVAETGRPFNPCIRWWHCPAYLLALLVFFRMVRACVTCEFFALTFMLTTELTTSFEFFARVWGSKSLGGTSGGHCIGGMCMIGFRIKWACYREVLILVYNSTSCNKILFRFLRDLEGLFTFDTFTKVNDSSTDRFCIFVACTTPLSVFSSGRSYVIHLGGQTAQAPKQNIVKDKCRGSMTSTIYSANSDIIIEPEQNLCGVWKAAAPAVHNFSLCQKFEPQFRIKM